MITRIAGIPGQCATPTGEGVPATSTTIIPYGSTATLDGTIYYADPCFIRSIDPAGIIRAFGGSDYCGTLSGDGTPPTNATLGRPIAVASGGGRAFIADAGNCRVRMIQAETISTVTPACATFTRCLFPVDPGCPRDVEIMGGRAYFLLSDCTVYEYDPADGLAPALSGICGTGLTADTDDGLLFADANCRIVRIDTLTWTTEIVAGTDCSAAGIDGLTVFEGSLGRPNRIAVAPNGDIYFTDYSLCRVRRIDRSTLVVSTVLGGSQCYDQADGLTGTAARIGVPGGVAVGPDGVVYVSDRDHCKVHALINGMVGHIAGRCGTYPTGDGGPALDARFARPTDLAIDEADLLIVDEVMNRVRRLNVDPDLDDDGIANASDPCPFSSVAGPNTDGDFIDLTPYGRSTFDATVPASDTLPDACDHDDDNDGLWDDYEYACSAESPATDPLRGDTDGDYVLDNAECWLGSDPISALSVPVLPTDDVDNDRLPADLERILETSPTLSDSDGDRLSDGLEYKYYGSDPLSRNSDLDDCPDGKEVGSVDRNRNVNAQDLGLLASAFGPADSGRYVPPWDLNRDGHINSMDLGITAANYGRCV
jgi:hypothetical protein